MKKITSILCIKKNKPTKNVGLHRYPYFKITVHYLISASMASWFKKCNGNEIVGLKK